MSHNLLTILIMVDLVMSVGALYLVVTALRTERARSEKYVSALLHKDGSHKAASIVADMPVREPVTDDRTARRQIGLSQ